MFTDDDGSDEELDDNCSVENAGKILSLSRSLNVIEI